MYPSLRHGQTNIAVAALQAGLRRYLVKRGRPFQNRANGTWGDGTTHDVNVFKSLEGLQEEGAGRAFGTTAWRALDASGSLGKYDRMRLDKHLALIDAARKAAQQTTVEITNEVGARLAVAAVLIRFHNDCRDTYTYDQVRPMPSGLFVPEAHDRLDCSSTCKLAHREAGLPPPDGVPYENGSGWTGSMWATGVKVETPRAGDFAFYGWDSARGAPKHMAGCISSAEVVSFGHTPIERYPLRYRSDFLGCRSYL